jgi:hypothetical protein
VLPGFRASHVVHLPFAAHPTSAYHVYDYDADHIRQYAEASKTPKGFRDYLDKYVYGTKDHWEYLELIGGAKHMARLAADPVLGY